MAQTGYTPISIYNSATTTNVPTAGNLVAGELAINTADGKLFYKDSSGVVQTIATKSSAALGGSTTGTGATVLQTSPTVTTPTIDKINTSVANTSLGAGNASIMKNRIINGAMVISQRNGTSTVTPSTNGTYTLDRWQLGFSSYAASKFNVAQNLNSVTPPVGFTNYAGIQVASTATPSSTDNAYFAQPIEANNMGDLAWGTANAKTVTLSFQVYVSVTGTYSGSIFGYSSGRSYPFSFTVSSANTWTPISITIAGDTSGTWAISNSGFAYVLFNLGSGSSNLGTAGSWSATQYFGATGSVQLISNASATFYITGVQLEVGSSATGFEYVNYQTSLANCQRYYYKIINGSGNSRVLSGYITTTTQALHVLNMPVSMRTSPTALETDGTAAHYAISNLNTDTTCSAVPSYNDSTINTVSVVGAVTAGLVAGGGCQLRYLNAAGYLAVSAEL